MTKNPLATGWHRRVAALAPWWQQLRSLETSQSVSGRRREEQPSDSQSEIVLIFVWTILTEPETTKSNIHPSGNRINPPFLGSWGYLLL